MSHDGMTIKTCVGSTVATVSLKHVEMDTTQLQENVFI